MIGTKVILYRADVAELLIGSAMRSHWLAIYDELAKAQRRRSELHIPLVGIVWATSSFWTQDFFRWAQMKRLLPRLCLRGADLRGLHLRAADLPYADLSESDLRGADLRGANLCGARLDRADLSGADLTHASRFEDDHPIPGWNCYGGSLYRSCPRGSAE